MFKIYFKTALQVEFEHHFNENSIKEREEETFVSELFDELKNNQSILW